MEEERRNRIGIIALALVLVSAAAILLVCIFLVKEPVFSGTFVGSGLSWISI